MATFRRRLIAYREHKMHKRRARPGKLAPVLTAQALCRKSVLFKKLQRKWVHAPRWMAPRIERFELILSETVKHHFRHDAARRIPGNCFRSLDSASR